MFALVCSGRKRMVNFRGTCDLPLFLSQTTASVNKEGERKMYCGRLLFFLTLETVFGEHMQKSAKMPSQDIHLGNMRRS